MYSKWYQNLRAANQFLAPTFSVNLKQKEATGCESDGEVEYPQLSTCGALCDRIYMRKNNFTYFLLRTIFYQDTS